MPAEPDKRESAIPDLVWPPRAPAESDIVWLDDVGDGSKGPDQLREISGTQQVTRDTKNASATDRSVPLDELAAHGNLFEWPDAIALVHQLAEQLLVEQSGAGAIGFPALHDIQLTSSGRIAVQLNPASAEPVIHGLGLVLRQLLSGQPAPPNLRLFAMRWASDGPNINATDVLRDLAGWERPGDRLEKLSRLHGRAVLAPPPPKKPNADPFDSQPPKQPAEPPKRSVEPPKRKRISNPVRVRRALILSAAFGFTIVILIGAWFVWSRVGSTSPASATGAPADVAPNASDAAQNKTPNHGTAPARSKAADSGFSLPRPRSTASSATPPAERDAQDISVDPPGTLPIRRPDDVPQTTRATERGSTPRSVGTPAVEPPLYHSGDPDVIAPVLIRPQLPTRPRGPVPADLVGVLELVIDENGGVESVRLNSPANRYRDRWWVFAAKGWRFRPAFKDGRPVRFVTRIPITDLNLNEPQ